MGAHYAGTMGWLVRASDRVPRSPLDRERGSVDVLVDDVQGRVRATAGAVLAYAYPLFPGRVYCGAGTRPHAASLSYTARCSSSVVCWMSSTPVASSRAMRSQRSW